MTAREIYTERLLHVKRGQPLWNADPHNELPVEIADVGYVRDGAWIRLFNASKPVEDPHNKLHPSIPTNHVSLFTGTIKQGGLSKSSPIMSKEVKRIGIHGNVSAGYVIYPAVNINFL
ncbi:hypothetical protein BU17DRAFT_35795 [Hysterangium stoloniferum]|nr:hypothetical protein BU17DRAFT_35795 [Hysterangium stoloniferum]